MGVVVIYTNEYWYTSWLACVVILQIPSQKIDIGIFLNLDNTINFISYAIWNTKILSFVF